MERSLQVEYVLNNVKELGVKFNQVEVHEDLFFVALYDEGQFDVIGKLLYSNGFSNRYLHSKIEDYFEFNDSDFQKTMLIDNIELGDDIRIVLNKAEDYASTIGTNIVTLEHIMLALLETKNEFLLDYYGYGNPKKLRNAIVRYLYTSEIEGINLPVANIQKYTVPKVILDNCDDLTAQAENGELDPVVGRNKEIDMIVQTLARRTKNNVLLLGESGTGKTAIVKGLALRIANEEIPALSNKRIFSLKYGKLMTDTKFRGDLEGKVQKLMDAFLELPDAILFIDEIHMLLGSASSESKTDIASMIKPMITDRKMQIIGATTFKESKKLEADQAFLRRFNTISLEEPNEEDTFAILASLKYKYEEFHNVVITDEILKETIRLTNRYITLRHQPDKSIDVIDEAAAKAKLKVTTANKNIKKSIESELTKINTVLNGEESWDLPFILLTQYYEKREYLMDQLEQLSEQENDELNTEKYILTINDVAKIVEDRTNIPVSKLMASDKQKLLTLEEDLMKGVIGQNQACKAIANAVRRNSAGINNPNKPIASFLFAGKSGVGKTEAAKVLADLRFGSRDNIVRIDCSEYAEEHAVSKLIGSNPGYVGYNEGGVLTEAIKNKPYAIVLFDEIEKAHSKFTEILLQVLDEGRLTDNTGTTISFKNTIIIMTTNMGSSLLDKANSVGFGSKDKQVQEESAYEKLKDVTMESIKKQLRPEVINRIDDIIVFHSLNKEDLRQITRLLGKQLDKRLAVLNITATCSEEALDFIADNGGYNEAYGARPLAKAIVKHIEEPLSIMILQDEIMPGQSVWIDLEDGKLTFKVIDNTMEAVSE